MVNENKIRILYVQPGKYPEERFVANELHPLQQLVGGYMPVSYTHLDVYKRQIIARHFFNSFFIAKLMFQRCPEIHTIGSNL